MFDRSYDSLSSSSFELSSENQDFSPETYAFHNPENESEASLVELLKNETIKNESIIDDALSQLNAWTKKTGLTFTLERAKLEDRRQEYRFNQHLNFVDLINLMAAGPSIDRSYQKLSGTSKEMFRLFIRELPAQAFDHTRDSVADIATAYERFTRSRELPTDLQKMLRAFYEPLREAAAAWQSKPTERPTITDPQERENLLRYI